MTQLEKILITGASGLLGRYLTRHFVLQEIHTVGAVYNHACESYSNFLQIEKVNLINDAELFNMCNKISPTVIIHCAGLTNVDLCEDNPELAYQSNADIAANLAEYAYANSSTFIYISTDHLFEGDKSFCTEQENPKPLNIYAESKLRGENLSLQKNPNSIIIRTNFFGKGSAWRHSFSDWIWQTLTAGKELTAFTDSHFTPIAIPELVKIIEMLMNNQQGGIFNVCGSERLSKFDFAYRFANYFNLPSQLIKPVKLIDVALKAKRPFDMSLNVEKVSTYLGISLPNIRQSFDSIKNDYDQLRV